MPFNMQHLSANKLFVLCMCQHSSRTVFIQGRVKLSKYIVCKLCSVPLQLLLGMGRELSAATALHVFSSQLKHCKSCCSDHVYRAVSAKCPVQSCLLLSCRRWESRAKGPARQPAEVAWTEAGDAVPLNEETRYIPHLVQPMLEQIQKEMGTTEANCTLLYRSKHEYHLLKQTC